jgi:hypothetical protein
VWGTLSARLERYDVSAPIIFMLAGLLLTHGPLAPLGFGPSHELVQALAEITLVLVLGHSSTSVTETVYRHEIRAALTKATTAMNRILKANAAESA